MQPEPEPRRVPLGEAIQWTEEDLDRMSEVSAQDIEESKVWVQENASERGRQLWEAQPLDETQ